MLLNGVFRIDLVIGPRALSTDLQVIPAQTARVPITKSVLKIPFSDILKINQQLSLSN